MYIGKLNDRLQNLNYRVKITSTDLEPACKEAGNPFLGETFLVSWKEMIGQKLDLAVSFEGDFHINQILLKLDRRSAPRSIRLFDAERDVLLDSYFGETGKQITSKEIALSVEASVNGFVLEIDGDFSSVAFSEIGIYGADLSGVCLYPIPRTLEETGGRIPAAWNKIETDCPEAASAAELFLEKYGELTGAGLDEKAKATLLFSSDPTLAENAFAIRIEEKKTVVRASDLRGFVMGAESVLKLIEDGSVPLCRIEDAPMVGFRGVHLYLPAEEEMEFTKRLIKYVLSPAGYNHIIMEVAGALEYESHPEINRAWEEAEKNWRAGLWPRITHGMVGGGKTVRKCLARDLADYARRFGIEIIPEIQGLSHVQFMTLAHPEIAEIPAAVVQEGEEENRVADATTGTFYQHSFCPSNPKSYELLFDLAEEILDTFRPKKYVHVGHDEVYQFGVCEKCSKRDPVELFCEDIQKLHDFYSAKGLTMMMWADMLQPVSKYPTPAAAERLPKDIVLLDFIWYFHLPKDIEDNLLPLGFPVAFGNLYSSHFPRFESRIRKPIFGAQISAWVETKESTMQSEGKFYDFLYTAGMLWSESYRTPCRYSYDRILRKMIPAIRERVQDKRYPSLHGGKRTILVDRALPDPEGEKGISLSVNASFDSLLFEHYTVASRVKHAWVLPERIGAYTVTYEDGETVEIPVTYGGNVSHYARRQNEPFPQPYYRHTGYSATWTSDAIETETVHGDFATVYRYEWINPKPASAIRSIEFVPAEGCDKLLCVNALIGVRL